LCLGEGLEIIFGFHDHSPPPSGRPFRSFNLKVVGIDWIIKRKNSGAINPAQLMKPKQHSCKKWFVKASIDL
jgi:hypothetical protein